MEIRIAESFAAIAPNDWNRLVEATNPFMRHEFLSALERAGCIGKDTAWQIRLFLGYDKNLIVALPAFLRGDSYGEYIFDWAWANAYAQAGMRYYPKITVAAPFTPATGKRLLGDTSEAVITRILTGVEEYCRAQQISGIHILCETRAEQRMLSQFGFAPRLTHQYHWLNRGFKCFDDYLDLLRSHRRKEIKRERNKANDLGLKICTVTGDAIDEDQMLAMYNFYLATYARKWGSPYLNRAAFLELYHSMREYLVLVLAYENKKPVAGALAFRAAQRLFGRYWGATAYFPYLHFELCLYRLIDYAIAERIEIFEAGAQGEHKFSRGFTAMPIYSSHKLFHPQGFAAIKEYVRQERRATERAIRAYRRNSPNKDELEYLPELED